jgi:hypothetical protein
MRLAFKVIIGIGILAGLVYLYYTEKIKPVVIFGLRSDYAHAIPFQKVPAGLASLKAESCGECTTAGLGLSRTRREFDHDRP